MKIGAYYYPEQWPKRQWKRDFDQMATMKLRIVHMGEFAWHTMEPREGEIQLDWLSECVELAVERKMEIILCTPTAAPPNWMAEKYPEILLMDPHGTLARVGGRRHYSPTSQAYIDHCRRIVTALVQRFGQHSSLLGWQIDNEYSGPWDQHDYTHAAFRQWLQNKYKTIDELNRAWGCQFWNTFYDDWRQVMFPPSRSLQYDNPHQHLDGSRFWSWAWANFNHQQAEIIRGSLAASAARRPFITTNFMPFHLDADPADMRDDLNLFSWDAYPVSGRDRGMADETYRMGDPALLAFTHDQMASYTGRWGQMELQPGHVNWSGYPALLYPGVVRLWIWTAFAHGAEFVTTYRFRQPLFGTEMFHSGLIDTTGATPTLAGREFTDTIEDLERLDPGKIKNTSKNTTEVGLVFDFDQLWHYDILPQAKRWNQSHLLLAWYRALARLGLRIKIIQANQPWPNELPMIVAPGLQMIDEHLLTQMNRYAQSGGNLLLTCRTAWMNRQGQLFEGKIAQPILKLIGGQIEAYDSMPEHIAGQIEMDNEKYHWSIWAELLYNEPTTKILAKYADQFYEDVPAITQNKLASGTVTYCGVYPEQKLLNALVAKLAAQFKLPATPLPDRVHVVRRGKYDILLNYQDKPVSAPAPKDAQFIIGAPKVEPAGIAVWEIE